MSENNGKAEAFESKVRGFTLGWIIFSFFIAVLYMPSNADWSDIGALLSGIFAPIAWAWFYASYKLQSSELQLQRKELTLQRKALETQVEELKHSVQAQKGSEAALKEQSEALQKQLKMTSEQFELTITELMGKKPLFTPVNKSCFRWEFLAKGDNSYKDIVEIKESDNLYDFKLLHTPYMEIKFEIKNIGGDCNLKKVEVFNHALNSAINLNTEDFQIQLACRALPLNENQYNYDNYQLKLIIQHSKFETWPPRHSYHLVEKLMSPLKLKFYYSYSDSSSSDVYELSVTRDSYDLIKCN